MSHIISLKVTKFQQALLITLGVADEKPEGGQKAPPPRDIGFKGVNGLKQQTRMKQTLLNIFKSTNLALVELVHQSI